MMVCNVWICKCSLYYCIYVMAHTLNLDYEHVYVISVTYCNVYLLFSIYGKFAYYQSYDLVTVHFYNHT